MLQYCRYCAHALDYNGKATEFLCEANAPCGNDGAGKFYPPSKAKRPNKCKHFVFNSYDIFRVDTNGNYVEYKPREKYIKREGLEIEYEQIEIGGSIK